MGWDGMGGGYSRLFGLPAACVTDEPKLGPTSVLAEQGEMPSRSTRLAIRYTRISHIRIQTSCGER